MHIFIRLRLYIFEHSTTKKCKQHQQNDTIIFTELLALTISFQFHVFLIYFETLQLLGFSGCEAEPCLNGATCQELQSDFVCKCEIGFGGVLCEEGKLEWFYATNESDKCQFWWKVLLAEHHHCPQTSAKTKRFVLYSHGGVVPQTCSHVLRGALKWAN